MGMTFLWNENPEALEFGIGSEMGWNNCPRQQQKNLASALQILS